MPSSLSIQLTGRSIRELIGAGLTVRPEARPVLTPILDQRSDQTRHSVALSARLFVPRSGHKTFSHQLRLLNNYTLKFTEASGLSIAGAFVATVSDWLDVCLQFFQLTGRYPLDVSSGHRYTRTARLSIQERSYILGGSSSRGINVREFALDSRNQSVGLAPMFQLVTVEPSRSTSSALRRASLVHLVTRDPWRNMPDDDHVIALRTLDSHLVNGGSTILQTRPLHANSG